MANPIEDAEGILTIGMLIAIIIGAVILFNKFDLGKLFSGLSLFPKKTADTPNSATSANDPLADVRSLFHVFDAKNPEDLSQSFSDWFSKEFGMGGGSPTSASTVGVQQGTPVTSGSALSGDTVSDYNPPADSVQQGTPA